MAENSGDCREALETLRRAGRTVDRRGKSEVTSETLKSVF
ncbi:hypothetical protein [Haloarchaeobius sp. HRN-SO-5]